MIRSLAEDYNENRTASLGLSSFEDVKKMLPEEEPIWLQK
jgi:hypothetical protein